MSTIPSAGGVVFAPARALPPRSYLASVRAYRDGDRLALISCDSIGLGGSDWRPSFDLGLERRGGPNEDGSGTIRRSRNTGTPLGDPGPTIE